MRSLFALFKRKVFVPQLYSIRLRVLLLVVIVVLVAAIPLAYYISHQTEKDAQTELAHKALLLSNALEAGIFSIDEVQDIPSLQNRIDRLSEALESEIEVNIIMLQGEKSAIVASNIAENIGETSERDHKDLLAVLEGGEPIVLIRGEDESQESAADSGGETPPETGPSPPSSFDDFPSEDDHLVVSTPLIVDDQKIGSINVKLSVDDLEEEIETFWDEIRVVTIIEILLVIAGLTLLLNRQIFIPLKRMSAKMHVISTGDLTHRIGHEGVSNEIGELAESFDRMIDQLQTAFERERRFTADVAHELRTPLTALKGRIEVALNQSRTPEEYESTLRDLDKEVDRLTRLSADLLFLTRLGQGYLQPKPEKLNLSDLIEAVIEQIRPLAEIEGVRLIDEIPPEISTQGDPDHLIRILLNLLDNAVKYTPSNGQVTVKAQQTVQTVKITISDTGPGIGKEQLPMLFDRFYRIDAARSRDEGGAGLGLSIAYELARAHNGNIEVQSELGQGTTFTVNLPAFPE